MSKRKKKNQLDWQKLNEIFAAVVELESSAQQEHLRQISDKSLRSEVEAMLAAMRRADKNDFLQKNVFPIGAHILAEKENFEEKRIGNYRILREIGRGGMGAVYLAQREDFNQTVALKIIKRGMDSDEIVRRFRLERQVLASLNHPNIARLLDGGTTDDGLPFFVMEYIEGETITKFCDRRKLSIEERLALFRKVCAAVAYAHQNLIVHRDLKPSNILITQEGEPKLLDFGISKLLRGEAFGVTIEQTATNVRLMTPEYASPEQIRGENITTASDIYSLGVMLYELLSGRRPFRLTNRSSVEVLKIVSEQQPPAPSTAALTSEEILLKKDTKEILSPETVAESRGAKPEKLKRRLRGDLDNIVLMSLRKETERRYHTVEQFAEDLRRHLEGLPVLARPATLGYHVSKFVRRNRVSVAFAAVALMALLAGFSVAVWQAYIAKKERVRAERQFNNVRRLANSLLKDYDEDILNLPGSVPVRLKLAEASSNYLDGLTRETNDPAVLKELAEAHLHLSDVYDFSLISPEQSAEHLRRATEIARRLRADAPDDLEAKELLAKCLTLSGFDSWQNEPVYRELMELREQIATEKPRDFNVLQELADFYMGFADFHLKSGTDEQEAFDLYRRAVETRRCETALLGAKSELSPEEYDALFNAHLWIGISQGKHFHDWQTALETFRQAVETSDRAAAKFPDDRRSQGNLNMAHAWLAQAFIETGDYETALREYRFCLQSVKENAARYNAFAHQTEAKYLLAVAETLQKLGRGDEALATIREAVNLRRRATEVDAANPRTRHSHAFIVAEAGNLIFAAGRRDEALALYREAETLWQKLLETTSNSGEARLYLAKLYLHLGDLYANCKPDSMEIKAKKRSQLEKARDYYQKSVALFGALQSVNSLNLEDKENFRIAAEKLRFVERA